VEECALKNSWIRKSLALMVLAFFVFAHGALAEGDSSPATNADNAAISALTRTLAPGERFSLSVQRVFPEGAAEPLRWTSSNANVASVSSEASAWPAPEITVTAGKNGTAIISLVGARSGKTLAKCKVTVRTVKIKSMAVSPKSLTMAPGRSAALSISVKPTTATFQSVRWVSSDPNILSFASGAPMGTRTAAKGEKVTAYARGTGKVTVSATAVAATGSDLKTTRRTVTVKTLNVSKVTLPKTKTLYLGDADPSGWKLAATVSPALVGEDLLSAVVYASTRPDVAEVDPSTGALTPKKSGVTYVTATVGGKKSNRCKVTVAQKAIKSVSVTTPEDAPVVLDPGETAQLKSVATPSYAYDRGVKWFSDRPGVATVDEGTGLVKAVSGGAATITCQSSANPRVKATVKVHVRGAGVYDTVTVTSAGDAVLGGDQRSGKAVQNPKSYQAFRAMVTSLGGDAMVFDKVKAYFEGDTNFSTLNLEGTLTLKDTRDKKKPFVFQGDPNYARTMLKVAGIDAVNLANNHTYDVGKDGYNGTIRALSKPDIRIQYYGNGTTAYVTKSGVKVAFLGYVSKGVYMSKMRSEIRAAAKKADVVVVHFHWTDVAEFKYAKPTSRQQYLARYAINNGADLVTGEHTHRVSGIERYRGRYIVYDLGNFVTMASNPVNQFGPDNEYGKYDYDSMIVQQKFNIWKEDGFVESAGITIIPCAITSQYAEKINNAQPTPYPAGSAEYQRVMARVRSLSPSPAAFDTYPINKAQ